MFKRENVGAAVMILMTMTILMMISTTIFKEVA